MIAILAPSELPYALSRVWKTWADATPWQTTVVRTREEAARWLETRIEGPVDLDGPAFGEPVFAFDR